MENKCKKCGDWVFNTDLEGYIEDYCENCQDDFYEKYLERRDWEECH